MNSDKQIILFGAGIIGRRALNYFGADKVYCFADNNRHGQIFCDKPVISFEELVEIRHDYDIVLSVGAGAIEELILQCKNNVVCYNIFDQLVSYEDYESNPDIRKFKDKHKGERCFLVGNGPSLSAEDLTTLHDYQIVSFGCNHIFRMYAQTPWRPNYYVASDPVLFVHDVFLNTEAEYNFIPHYTDSMIQTDTRILCMLSSIKEKTLHYHPISYSTLDAERAFSPDVSKAIYISGTVMYNMIQIAVYMGFTRIYLIGVDGTSSTVKDPNKYLSKKRHFYKENEDVIKYFSQLYAVASLEKHTAFVSLAYKKADEYTRERGIRIFNATSGGMVEAFERVCFKSLFEVE